MNDVEGMEDQVWRYCGPNFRNLLRPSPRVLLTNGLVNQVRRICEILSQPCEPNP